ncbi:MAG: hypothetical protein GKR89_10720 [Candidatus Latescibacteria bacterium]|nr:hypothetical protein [Candidatus Latescibacterota bacterium]
MRSRFRAWYSVFFAVFYLFPLALPLEAQAPLAPGIWAGKAGRKRVSASPLTAAAVALTAEKLHQSLGPWARAKSVAPPRVSDGQPSSWELALHEGNGTPVFLSNGTPQLGAAKPAAPLSPARSQALALDFIDAHRRLFRLQRPRAELDPGAVVADAGGRFHVAFQQHFGGIPLWGCDLVVHLLPDGTPYAVNARYVPTPLQDSDLVPAIGPDRAIHRALGHLRAVDPDRSLPPALGQLLGYDGPVATQYLRLEPGAQVPHLVWHVEVRPRLGERWYCFVDAHTGRVLEAYNAAPTQGPVVATALDLGGQPQRINVYEVADSFCLLDGSRAGPAVEIDLVDDPLATVLNNPFGSIFTLDARHRDLSFLDRVFHVSSSDNSWSDPVAVSAHYYTNLVFEYFSTVHGRRGLDGRDGTVFSIIHVTNEGRALDNAFWNGGVIAYGDGDRLFAPLAGALDVVAHELTHGIVAHTLGLEYRFQAGALNESLADIFAAMVDRDDWLLAEDVANPGVFPSGAARNMADPHNGGQRGDFFWQPAHMDEYVELDLSQDNGGVHINSGIPNRAAFLIAQALGREKTERIYYRVLAARYLNRRANFTDMRRAAALAAQDLFGDNGPEVQAVLAAFDEVGIEGGIGALPAADRPRFEGEEWIAAINADAGDRSLWLARPEIESDGDLVQLTSTQVRPNTGNPISVSADGALILFVDEDNFIRAIDSDGAGETIVSDAGDWSSIALSPDGTRLAATTVFRDSTIFIFDLVDPQASKRVRLYNPTTQEGVRTYTIRFADALDWTGDGRFLVYDALNSIPRDEGRPIEFWTINLLEVDSERIPPLLGQAETGVGAVKSALVC